MSTVALDRSHGITATTELLVLEPVSQRLGLEPIVLAPGEISIGSDPECKVRLEFPGIAARHCVLSCSRNRVSLRALDRRTWINSLPLLEGRLKTGDRLAVGPVEFRVRKAEPWDIAPVPEALPIAQVIHPVETQPAQPVPQLEHLEARLLQQIAHLESEIARQQAAVSRLTAPPVENQHASMSRDLHVGEHQSELTQADEQTDKPVVASSSPRPAGLTTPVFHLAARPRPLSPEIESPVDSRTEFQEEVKPDSVSRPSATPGYLYRVGDEGKSSIAPPPLTPHATPSEYEGRGEPVVSTDAEQPARYLIDSEANRLQRQQLELACRQVELEQQTCELEARWAELEQAKHEADQSATLRLQLEQALSERELQCNSRESELVRREVELRLGLARLEERDAQHRTEAARIAEQLAALQSREQELESLSNQVASNRLEVERQSAELDHSRRELARQQTEFVRREQNWRLKSDLLRSHAIAADIDRQAAAAVEARRTEALDRKQSDLQCLLEELHSERQAVEDSANRLQHEHEQSAATRTALELRQVELDQFQQGLHRKREELDTRESAVNTRNQELATLEQACQMEVADLRNQQARLQAETDRIETWQHTLSQQQAALDARTIALEEHTAKLVAEQSQLDNERNRLAQWSSELERQQTESACREQNWRLKSNLSRSHAIAADIDRQAAAAAEVRRTETLDRKQSELQRRLEELHLERQAVEDSANRLQQEHDQSVATRTSLEQRRVELDQLQQALHQQREELAARENAANSRNEELTTLEQACQVEVADLRNQQARLQAETDRFEAWQHELTQQQATLDARSITFEEHTAKLIAEQSLLEHEQTRLTNWSGELERQQAGISRDRHELQSQIQEHELRTDELLRRTSTLDELRLRLHSEQAVLEEHRQRVLDDQTRVTSQLERVATEQSRLTAWQAQLDVRATELSQLEAAAIRQQQELDAGWADLERTRRTSAEEVAAGSATLNAEQLQLETLRQELFLAECEIEEVEADLAELEQQLQIRKAELDARDNLLQQAECHVAWLQREHELQHSGTENQSSPQWHDQELNKLATQLNHLFSEYDALACEHFAQSNLLDNQSRDASEFEMHLRMQAAELEQHVQACHTQRAELDAERSAARQQYEQWRIERQEHEVDLERCQSALTEKLRALEIEWTNLQSEREEFNLRRDELDAQQASLSKQQADFAVQHTTLNAQREASAAHQQELLELRENLNAQQSELELERQTFAEDFERFQCQQAELIRQQELLEEKQRQLDSRSADHEAALAAHVAERTAWEAEVAAARRLPEPLDPLASDSHEVATPDPYHHDSEIDDEELELLRKYSPALLNSEETHSQVLDQVSHLEHLVRDELEYESHPYETVERDDYSMDDVTALTAEPGEEALVNTEASQEGQPVESDDSSGTSMYGDVDAADMLDESRSRSLWSDEATGDQPLHDQGPRFAAEDQDPSVQDLRARLSEMFQFDLNDQLRHESTVADESEHPVPASLFASSDAAIDDDPPAVTRIPQASFVESPTTDPEVDEYDSVESYMQRLLDRNRRARSDEEPAPPLQRMAPEPVSSTIPESAQTELPTEAALVNEPPSEPVRALVPREPVDMQKVREGLVNLRQVANVSARSAVARSKWNKMRTRVAVQCVCLVGCWLVGGAILSGKLTGAANVASWGWSAIALGFGIAVHAIGEVSSIFRNNRVTRKPTE